MSTKYQVTVEVTALNGRFAKHPNVVWAVNGNPHEAIDQVQDEYRARFPEERFRYEVNDPTNDRFAVKEDA